jgi:hypothetical protein
MKFEDFNLLDLGNSIGVTGIIMGDNGKSYLWILPDQNIPRPDNTEVIPMDLQQWKKGLQQVDTQEVEILQKDQTGGLVKAIVRKTQRVIEQRISWAVYERDKFHCCYCGRGGIPLTVDHLVLWEEGGPSIEENLLTACRKCNKVRGNMQYADWLKFPYYLKVSANLSPPARKVNELLAAALAGIPRRHSERSSR